MTRLRWDKRNEDDLMKKHGVETINKDTFVNIKEKQRKKHIKKKSLNESGPPKTSQTGLLIQCKVCSAKVRKLDRHMRKVHKVINDPKKKAIKKREFLIKAERIVTVAALAKELLPFFHKKIMEMVSNKGIKISSAYVSIPENVAEEIRAEFRSNGPNNS